LDEDMPAMGVAGLRDRAEPYAVATRVLFGHESEIAGQLAGMRKAPPVANLRGEDHRGVERDAAEALQRVHHGGERREQRELLDPAVEFFPALELVLEERMIFAEDEPVVRRERRALGGQMLSPLQMRRAPVGPLAIHEAAAG